MILYRFSDSHLHEFESDIGQKKKEKKEEYMVMQAGKTNSENIHNCQFLHDFAH